MISHNKKLIRILFSIGLLLFTLAADRAWGQSNRFALILGNNTGSDANQELKFAETDARRFHKVLTEFGGFHKDQAKLLLGADADQVWQAIYALEKKISAHKDKSGQKNLLVFYYSGHADGDALELGDTVFRFKNLIGFLQSSIADVRLAFLDSCKSGKLVSMKGANPVTKTDFRVEDQIRSSGYAIITSSAFNELSQESQEIRGAYFTHYLVSALRGAGDKSNDGKITLGEAYEYAYNRTLAKTSTTIGGSQHPMYEFKLEGRGDIVLTRTDQPTDTGVSIELPESGRLILLDELGDEIIAEVEIMAQEVAHLSMRKGNYLAYLLTPDNAVRRARATVVDDRTTALGMDDFETVHLEQTVSKGGLFRHGLLVKKSALNGSQPSWTHTLSAGGQWRLLPIDDGTSAWGAAISYRLLNRPTNLQPVVSINWATKSIGHIATDYNAVGILGGLGYVWYLSDIALHLEALVGYDYHWQGDYQGEFAYTSGFNYMGLIGFEMPVDALVVGIDVGAGGRVLQVLEKGWVHRLDAQVMISLGYRWGG
jgi:hypothetical protein